MLAYDPPILSEFKRIASETATEQGVAESSEEYDYSSQPDYVQTTFQPTTSNLKMCQDSNSLLNITDIGDFSLTPCNESDFDFDSFILLENPHLLDETFSVNDYDTSTSEDLNPADMLPGGCTFEDTYNVAYRTVICQGLNMTKVPVFSSVRNIDTLIFNHTGIQVLDRNSIESLPRVTNLVFMNGILMRVSYGELLKYHYELKNLTLINNSIYCLSFSNFYNGDENKESLEILDLEHNSISNLPDSPVNEEPVLPKLQTLKMGNNPMRVISGDFFYPLRFSPVKNLYLREASLYDFGVPDFQKGESPLIYLQQLELLDLSRNPKLTSDQIEQFVSALQNDSIKKLFLDDNSLLEVPKETLVKVKNTLEVLSMKGSSFYCLDSSAFPHMKKLNKLYLQFSRISEINEGTFDPLSVLKILHLDGNQLTSLPHAVSRPSIEELYFNRNPVTFDADNDEGKKFTIGRNSFDKSINLNTLDFTEVPLRIIKDYYFSNLPNLRNLQLSGCLITYITNRSFQNLTNLQILNLSQNKLRNVSEETFVGLYNLLYLDLSGNSLDFSENNDTEFEFPSPRLYKETNMIKRRSSSLPLTVFKDFYRLRSLNLKSNYIHFLFPEIFENFTQLKEIDLSHNRVRSWDIPIFNKSDQLQIVLLRDNDIQYLSDAMITDFSKPNLIVDLRDNILNCSCSLMAFDNELNETHFVQRDSYQCNNGTEYVSVKDYLQEVYEYNLCQEVGPLPNDPSKKMLIIGVMSGVMIILIFLSIVYYRNRWYIKYFAFTILYQPKFSKKYQDKNSYVYDSYICYAQPDRIWVFEKLITNLETEKTGLQVCIHERDFLPGEFITRNIFRAMELSKTVIVVITSSFVKSSWCMFELDLAASTSVWHRSNRLILVILEQIPKKQQPRSLRYHLKSRTYIPWVTDIVGERLFWKKLIKVIGKPISKNEENRRNDEYSEYGLKYVLESSSEGKQRNVSESSCRTSTTNLGASLSFSSVDSLDFESEDDEADNCIQNPSFTLCNEVVNFESIKNYYYENEAFQDKEQIIENLDSRSHIPFHSFKTPLYSKLIFEETPQEFDV